MVFWRLGLRAHHEILWGRYFCKTCKIVPKRIVYYSIGSHSAQLVLLYLQKLPTQNFQFQLYWTAVVVHQWKHGCVTRHLQILGSLAEMSTDQDWIGLHQDWSQFWPNQDWTGLRKFFLFLYDYFEHYKIFRWKLQEKSTFVYIDFYTLLIMYCCAKQC